MSLEWLKTWWESGVALGIFNDSYGADGRATVAQFLQPLPERCLIACNYSAVYAWTVALADVPHTILFSKTSAGNLDRRVLVSTQTSFAHALVARPPDLVCIDDFETLRTVKTHFTKQSFPKRVLFITGYPHFASRGVAQTRRELNFTTRAPRDELMLETALAYFDSPFTIIRNPVAPRRRVVFRRHMVQSLGLMWIFFETLKRFSDQKARDELWPDYTELNAIFERIQMSPHVMHAIPDHYWPAFRSQGELLAKIRTMLKKAYRMAIGDPDASDSDQNSVSLLRRLIVAKGVNLSCLAFLDSLYAHELAEPCPMCQGPRTNPMLFYCCQIIVCENCARLQCPMPECFNRYANPGYTLVTPAVNWTTEYVRQPPLPNIVVDAVAYDEKECPLCCRRPGCENTIDHLHDYVIRRFEPALMREIVDRPGVKIALYGERIATPRNWPIALRDRGFVCLDAERRYDAMQRYTEGNLKCVQSTDITGIPYGGTTDLIVCELLSFRNFMFILERCVEGGSEPLVVHLINRPKYQNLFHYH